MTGFTGEAHFVTTQGPRSAVIDPNFAELLDDLNREQLDTDPCTIFGTWPDLHLAYVNDAWFRFAWENGGEPSISRDWNLGRSVLDAVPTMLTRFYVDAYRRVLDSGLPWMHRYECSTPDTFREFEMRALPLQRNRGLLVIHALLVERPHEAGPLGSAAVDADYVDGFGRIVQCSHCRRVRRVDNERQWDWVPQWVEFPMAGTSHGLCPVCLDYHYPDPMK